MKVLAINGSPRGASGSTFPVADAFLQGAAETGAETEAVQVARCDIHACTGELHCFFKIPGKCIWDDDMADLLPKVAAADVLVLGSPLYFGGPTGQLKTFVDRLTPLLDPMAGLRGDGPATLRDGKTISDIVLVGSCGDWGTTAFDPLVAWAQAVANSLHSDFAGALLRPHAPFVRDLADKGTPPEGVYDAAREAGRQIVRSGTLKEETLAAVAQELIDFDAYVDHLRATFESAATTGDAPEA
ncbi:flavodoxin family protein [Planctomycetota bacterium]